MLTLALLVGCVGVEGAVAPTGDGLRPAPGRAGDEPEPERLVPAWTAFVPEPNWDGGGVDVPDGAELFREGVIHDLGLELSDAAITSLREEPTTQVEGTLSWKGAAYVVAVRLKGSTSFRPIDEKPSFKIDVHEYDREQELDGLERLTLNNMDQDGSMLREHGYYWLMRRMGVPAPRHGYARVSVNGEPYGLYGIIETLDEQFLKNTFPEDPDGNLYEADPADFLDDYDWFGLEEDGGVVPTWDDMDDLVDAVEETRSGGFYDMFQDRFDPSVLDFLAVDMVTGNSDGYVYNFHNHLPYHKALGDTWAILPWGADQAFRKEIPPLGDLEKPAEGYLFLACWSDPTCGPALRERANRVLDLFEDELADELTATADLIEDACDDDPRRDKSCTLDSTLDFVEDRVDYLRPYL